MVGFFSIFTVSVAPQATLQLVDDQREPIESPLEVCVVRGVDRSCSTVQSGTLEGLPFDFDFLTIDGEDHGPETIPRVDLEWRDNQSALATVPRKATLTVGHVPHDGARLTLYRVTDANFRQPVLRTSVESGGHVKVPAGQFLVSLSSKGLAPDLREVDLAPAQVLELEFQRRMGWSLVLRLSERDQSQVVEGASAQLQTASINLAPEAGRPRVAREVSSPFGLVLFSGLGESIVDALIKHPSFLPELVPALSATPGSFAFREVSLSRGGVLAVRVFLDGEPASGASCRLLVYERVPGSRSEPRKLWSATTDSEGVCRSSRLREGEYMLRVEAAGGTGRRPYLDLPVSVPEGFVEEVAARLDRVVVEGSILRGTRPAEGYRVVVHDLEAPKPYARDQDATAITEADEEGDYQITLWRPGKYRLHVQNPNGTPALVKRVELEPGSQTYDFLLGPHDIRGQVVDENRLPVEGASVSLNWEGWSFRRAIADDNGYFAFSLEEESGSAQLIARSVGYFASDPVDVVVVSDEAPAPVVLVLKENDGVEGRLVAGGGPVAGATVISYQEETFSNPRWLGQTTTDAQGRFQAPRAKNGATRLFFTGPGCPLGSRVPPRELPSPEVDVWQVSCASTSAGLELTVLTPDHTPRSGSSILLQRGNLVFPREALATHLARARLPFSSDANGRLFLAGLEPGVYDLFLAEANSPAALRMGARRGFLATVQLQPGATSAIEVVLRETIPKEAP